MGRPLFSWIWLIVVLCAKEMKTHNRTYSHLIRINTWRDSNNYRSSTAAPLPFAELIARSSLSPSTQSSESEAGDASDSCADNDPSCVERPVTKRQVDPLHSCIEAKCSSWNSGNYLDCVYRHCVSGFQMHGKRSADADESDDDTFAHPEGRFLLLPVTFQGAGDEPQLFPTSILQSGGDEAEEPSAPAARVRLARRRLSAASRNDGDYRRNKHDRVKRNAVEWTRGRPVDKVRASLLPRRSYNDIADVCVEHHCGQMQPHTISYFQCVDRYCTGKRI